MALLLFSIDVHWGALMSDIKLPLSAVMSEHNILPEQTA